MGIATIYHLLNKNLTILVLWSFLKGDSIGFIIFMVSRVVEEMEGRGINPPSLPRFAL